MSEFRDPDAWRARSRIPRSSGSWIGVARVQTVSRADDSWIHDDWVEEACLDDGPVPDHVDARAWAASMLAAQSRHGEFRHAEAVVPPSARLEPGAVIPAPRSAPESDAAWPQSAEPTDFRSDDAVAGRE